MPFQSRSRGLLVALTTVVVLAVPAWRGAWAAPVRPQLNVTGYVISADVDPALGKLTASVDVTFTALEDLTSASFELNNGLAITKLTDKAGNALNSERLTSNSTVRHHAAGAAGQGFGEYVSLRVFGHPYRLRHQPGGGDKDGGGG